MPFFSDKRLGATAMPLDDLARKNHINLFSLVPPFAPAFFMHARYEFPAAYRTSSGPNTTSLRISSRTYIFAAIVACITGTAAVIGVYASTFLPFGTSLSRSTSDWGTFGEYVGDTVGTLFAFAAFVGVLITIRIQDKQLLHQQQQSHRDELQRLLASTSSTLDEWLASAPPNIPAELRESMEGERFAASTYVFLRIVGRIRLGHPEPVNSPSVLITHASEAVRSIAYLLIQELDQLATCLREYEDAGGSSAIASIYKTRYCLVATWVHCWGELRLSELAVQTFQADVNMKQLRDQFAAMSTLQQKASAESP
jgi:hypothetical protein